MSEKQKINILWFTKDLRIRDQESLFKIMQEELPFLAIYIFDEDFFRETQLGFKKIGKFRAKFLIETVDDLKKSLESKKIPFVIKLGETADVFKDLNENFEIEKIFCQEEFTRDEISLQNAVAEILPNAEIVKSSTQLLLTPEFVFSKIDKMPKVFTAFRQKIEKNLTVREEFSTIDMIYNKEDIFTDIQSDEITLEKLGFKEFEIDKRSAFQFCGGETAGLERMNYYFSESKSLSNYKNTRNGMTGEDYSSKFSAWLANGSLSAVSVYHEIKKYENEFGSNESTYWLIFELFWREFFKYIAIKFGDLIFDYNGILQKEYSHKTNIKLIENWKNAQNDSDFINANMTEIAKTGWMSNRGRQNVASYFCKTLNQNWQIGAAYFEEMLIDYDIHNNYCNWMYLAGVGNDPRDRTFNPDRQAEMYDADRKFRDFWLKNN